MNQDQHYQQWLELYEKAVKVSADHLAIETVQKTSDPMTDYKARAETALFCF